MEADRRARIARREPGGELEPEQLVELCARVLALLAIAEGPSSVMMLIERLPYPAEPTFDQNDHRTMVAFLDHLDTVPGDPETSLGDPLTWLGSLRRSLSE